VAPSKFQQLAFWFPYCSNVAQRSQPSCARRLALSWAGTLYIHFWRFLPRNGIIPGATFTLRPSLALSYFGSITAWHSSIGRQPNFVALRRGRHLYSAGRPLRWARWASAHILVLGFFLPNLRGCRLDVYHTSVHLECRSEICCTWLAGNTGRKNDAKKFTICAPSHNFVRLYLRN